MSAPKHAAGPWSVAATDDSLIVAGRTKIAATYEVEGDVWGQANARLIAAAPDLLEALQDVHAVSARMIEAVLSGDHDAALLEANALNVGYPARSRTIAKATGADQ